VGRAGIIYTLPGIKHLTATDSAVNETDRDSLGCFVCQKHRGLKAVPGGSIYEDALVYAGHAQIPIGEETVYLGYLMIEPKRHVPGLTDLTDQEAAALGVLIARLSRALRESEGAEHVYAFVLGDRVSHLHVHLVPRYPGAPAEYWGTHVDEWPGAPRGGPAEVAVLVQRLRDLLPPS
jgi:histidine triad (HIT) family protein